MSSNSQRSDKAPPPIHALSQIISPLRLGTYLNATGHDPERALALYLWNAKVGEAFHLPIQAVEVALRNRLSDGLAMAYGPEWWRDEPFLRMSRHGCREKIDEVCRRLERSGKPIETGQVIAGLSFGFWTSVLHGHYHSAIWSRHLDSAIPSLPTGITRRELHREAGRVADFRNRLWHHEPIFRRDLLSDYSRCMNLTGWLCPEKRDWIKPHCRVAAIMREKP